MMCILLSLTMSSSRKSFPCSFHESLSLNALSVQLVHFCICNFSCTHKTNKSFLFPLAFLAILHVALRRTTSLCVWHSRCLSILPHPPQAEHHPTLLSRGQAPLLPSLPTAPFDAHSKYGPCEHSVPVEGAGHRLDNDQRLIGLTIWLQSIGFFSLFIYLFVIPVFFLSLIGIIVLLPFIHSIKLRPILKQFNFAVIRIILTEYCVTYSQ